MLPTAVRKTLSQYILADGYPLVYDPKNSRGAYLRDAVSGKDYLDLFSFFASMPIGHNHPKLIEPAFVEQLGYLATLNPTNADIYTVEYATFVERFATVMTQPHFDHLFFVAGGSLAVENALKAAFDWKVRSENLHTSGSDVTDLKVIHFRNAFHGRSGFPLSCTNTRDPNKYLYFPKFDWPRIDFPAVSFPMTDTAIKRAAELEERSLAAIEKAIEANPKKIAAVVTEPIQGEGGDHHARPDFFKALREICDRRNVMLVFDEVQTGFGLTGRKWCFEHLGCVPDMIAFGKKTQVCGFAATRRIDTVDDNVFKVSSRINSTWGGNLVDMVRCHRYIDIIESENLVQRAADTGAFAMQQLQGLQEKRAELISNLRGRGLMIAFDLPSLEKRDAFIRGCFDRQVIVMPCGELSVRLRPHLDIEQDVLRKAIEVFDQVAAAL